MVIIISSSSSTSIVMFGGLHQGLALTGGDSAVIGGGRGGSAPQTDALHHAEIKQKPTEVQGPCCLYRSAA